MAFKDGYVDIPIEIELPFGLGVLKDTWRLYWDSYLGRKIVDFHDTSIKIINAVLSQKGTELTPTQLSLTAHGTGFEGDIDSNSVTGGTVASFTLAAKYGNGVSRTEISGFEPQDAATFFANMLDIDKDYEYAITLLSGDTTASVAKGARSGGFFDTGAGDDRVTGSRYDDVALKWLAGGLDFDAGKGSDTVRFQSEFTNDASLPVSGLVLDLASGIGDNPYGEGAIRLKSVENVVGTEIADVIKGTDARNVIGDGAYDGGADQIDARGGNDLVRISPSSNGAQLDGGAGRDTLEFVLLDSAFVIDLRAGGMSDGGLVIENFEVFTVSTAFASGQWTFTFYGSDAGETVNGSTEPSVIFPGEEGLYGKDVLHGGGGGDRLNGLSGRDELHGDAGDDVLTGGRGADQLEGGDGADRFRYAAAGDSTVATAGRDTISDFSAAEGDRLDLTALDANPARSGDQRFDFIGTRAFDGKDGQVRWEASGGDVRVEADIDGDGDADLAILVTGIGSLAAGDFVL